MKRWIVLPLLLLFVSSLGCGPQQQARVLLPSPVRFEDGTPVDAGEESRLSALRDTADGSRFLGSTDTLLDYSSWIIPGDENVKELIDRDFLLSQTTVEDGDTLVSISHAGAFVRLELSGIPDGLRIDRIELAPLSGTLVEAAYLDPVSLRTVPALETACKALPVPPVSGPLVLWMALPPQDLATTALLVHGPEETLWSARLPEVSLQSGIAVRWDAACVPSTPPGAGMTARPLPQTLLQGIQPGEYSGIARLGEDRYAVVSDDLRGGGILHFTIPVRDNGTVGRVTMQVPQGTETATGQPRDCEDVAYNPFTGTLYVPSETHQEILEYDEEGNWTGAAFRIPEDLSRDHIVRNRGFESLTFHPATERFWTLTEAPLKEDHFLPRILRLQSFDKDGEPAERYFYQMDPPQMTGEEADSAEAYVFGVSALEALVDGRLVILEREIYVPGGGLWDKLKNSFTRADLFLVDPLGDPAGLLRKTPLCSFRTGALNLANYEGLCLGPAIPGGQTLLLIADSQNGRGLNREYVKVILLEKP